MKRSKKQKVKMFWNGMSLNGHILSCGRRKQSGQMVKKENIMDLINLLHQLAILGKIELG